ncbi:MAG: hypothetical protein UV82_C0012G0029 [Candidatus Magasanikbacteria bacterium GW2011_GWD2_43_18]|uniref:Uncharacterized protein n=1 Tax=Candidatus Magasanikbacteria bacterium GW2011_GWE2_42_7 TaxID=1619052 RepID=A0A0G1EC10_9BACT|nr:MAG: hypothetical protein UV18_C0005G0116 [Candidatus Magasanikbacteria bacterium GW2011_GWC2_42_27]KKS72123.1 MAG: hypothetical protein UV42_C0013G0001 [Candidatus Magasanikbacteria bacterium GW2011_GWE2_42_7]KKT04044.1 MAG: hypothetical protein UV82_C0012G0029 [Candidatus Magasanikbacteria bacterium GW2011_GWD2_43_18]KKT25948.1 MAG: hypothetical protein UW10_C0003G0109 [Candidatus Magasanikbacteria bacterium GW2011_GWA2_43_9]HCC13407.1 hypothetical protein [Candidatus Magasanikbacteria bac
MTNTILFGISKYRVTLMIAATAFLSLLMIPLGASANVGDTCTTDANCDTGEICGTGGECAVAPLGNDPADTGYGLDYGTDIGLGDRALDDAVIGLINVLLGFLGLIAVIIILIGGFRWMTAGGNEDKVGEARKTIFAGIIGLAIILFAWGITTFVVQQLGSASGLSDTDLNIQ